MSGDWFSAGKGRAGRDLSGYMRSRGPLLYNFSSWGFEVGTYKMGFYVV